MISITKSLFDKTCAHVECRELLHPSYDVCWESWMFWGKQIFIGSMKNVAIYELIKEIFMRRKKLNKKEEWKKITDHLIRTYTAAVPVLLACFITPCVIRRLTGRFYYYGLVFIPNVIFGLCLILRFRPHRRGLFTNLYGSLVIEYLLRSLERDGFLSITKSVTKQVLMFMIGSAFLFYLMRLEGDKKYETPLVWFFAPEKVQNSSESFKNACPHKGTCLKFVLQGFFTYFGIGAAITLGRKILPQIKTPMKALSSIKRKHFKMAMFFGSYIGIYRAVVCYLCRKKGHDCAIYALPAGFLAGLSFAFNPNLLLAIASLTTAFKLYSTILYDKKLLPQNVPLSELTFSLCYALMIHSVYLQTNISPRYAVYNIAKPFTNGQSMVVINNLQEVVKRAS